MSFLFCVVGMIPADLNAAADREQMLEDLLAMTPQSVPFAQ